MMLCGISILLFSCQKNGDQIAVVKNDLKKWNKTENEIAGYQFEVLELMDKDAYKILYDKKNKAILETIGVGGDASFMEQDAKKLGDSVQQSKGEKTFYKVHYYRLVDKDTVGNGYLYLNDKNKKIGFDYIR